jgi:RNA-dependent RNA polymerase
LITHYAGDYDGDHGWVIPHSDIVSLFTNAPPHYADEPKDLHRNFEPVVMAIKDLLPNYSGLRAALQPVLLGGRYDANLVGIYNKFHAYAIYTLGYTHEETKRLAYM